MSFFLLWIFILSLWSWFSCWVICIDRVLLLQNKGCNILLENMPYQVPISWLHIAPRWVLVPYTKYVFNCLFFFMMIILLCLYWKTPGKWLIPFYPCHISVSHLCFLLQIPNLSAAFAGNIETVKYYFISCTFTVLSY